jgi:hypothetical protein
MRQCRPRASYGTIALHAEGPDLTRIDMGRLDDLEDVLNTVRSWDGVEEKGAGTFYLKRKPYLHFHVGRDSRRADIRCLRGWVQVDLPEPVSPATKRRFLALLRDEYEDRGAPARRHSAGRVTHSQAWTSRTSRRSAQKTSTWPS